MLNGSCLCITFEHIQDQITNCCSPSMSKAATCLDVPDHHRRALGSMAFHCSGCLSRRKCCAVGMHGHRMDVIVVALKKSWWVRDLGGERSQPSTTNHNKRVDCLLTPNLGSRLIQLHDSSFLFLGPYASMSLHAGICFRKWCNGKIRVC